MNNYKEAEGENITNTIKKKITGKNTMNYKEWRQTRRKHNACKRRGEITGSNETNLWERTTGKKSRK